MMSCTTMSHRHVLHSRGPLWTDLHGNVPPSSALHNSDMQLSQRVLTHLHVAPQMGTAWGHQKWFIGTGTFTFQSTSHAVKSICLCSVFRFLSLFFFLSSVSRTNEAVLAGTQGKWDGSPNIFIKHEDLDSGFRLPPVLRSFQD